jgi:hypothetical protein
MVVRFGFGDGLGGDGVVGEEFSLAAPRSLFPDCALVVTLLNR